MWVVCRRCGMITRREAERLCKSFLGDNSPPRLPDNFAFEIVHDCAWGCRGQFVPGRYNSSRAKCIKCSYCAIFFSPNKVGQEWPYCYCFVKQTVLCFSSCSTRTGWRRAGSTCSRTPPTSTRGGATSGCWATRRTRWCTAGRTSRLELCSAPSVPQPVVQSRRRPLLGPSPGRKRLLPLSHLRHY